MKILAVDTASNSCSVALTVDDILKIEYTVNHGRTHSVELGPMIDEVLRASGTAIADIDAFAVTTGPGSFTGLRIGIATIKGLAHAGSKPVAPVSTLDALAFQCVGIDTLICPLIDARKKEVYTAVYRWCGDGLETVRPPRVTAPDQALEGISEKCFFIGSGAILYRDLISRQLENYAYISPAEMNLVRASTVARLGYIKISEGSGLSSRELMPYYIRRSEVEKNANSLEPAS